MIDSADLKAPGNVPTFENIKREDIVDALSNANEAMDFLQAAYHYQVCPLPFISRESVHFLDVYRACGGFSRLACPDDYYQLSGLYVRAVKVIESELANIAAEKKAG